MMRVTVDVPLGDERAFLCMMAEVSLHEEHDFRRCHMGKVMGEWPVSQHSQQATLQTSSRTTAID